jgi:hypothetical protein
MVWFMVLQIVSTLVDLIQLRRCADTMRMRIGCGVIVMLLSTMGRAV